MSGRMMGEIKDCKLALEMAGLQSLPRFASYEEDDTFKNRDKWRHYGKKQVIMWDTTNIESFHFSNATAQRIMYSKYYRSDCCKGGAGVQLCGWIVTEDLWVGGVSNSDYNQYLGYLRDQRLFQEVDLVSGEVVVFLNIFDRGYKAKYAGHVEGQQETLQPPTSKSNERFTERTTVYAATIAHD